MTYGPNLAHSLIFYGPIAKNVVFFFFLKDYKNKNRYEPYITTTKKQYATKTAHNPQSLKYLLFYF